MKAWMRDLQVILSSSKTKKQYIFGNNWIANQDDLEIDVEGTKYLSATKDTFTIRINNLTYNEVLQLIDGQFYDIEIKAGYRAGLKTSGAKTIFKGSVIYISYQRKNNKDNTVIILAGSKLVSKYGQSKMNISLNSGINMYSAIQFMCKRAGIQSNNIDENFKNRILRECETNSSTISGWLEGFSNSNNFVVNADSTYGNTVSIFNLRNSNSRNIDLTNSSFVLISGYPKLNSEGLSMTLLPTYNLMTMDTIKIDNSLLNISTSDTNASSFNKSMYIDKEGRYVITQIEYSLNNKDGDFYMNITAKARSLYSNIGGLTNG